MRDAVLIHALHQRRTLIRWCRAVARAARGLGKRHPNGGQLNGDQITAWVNAQRAARFFSLSHALCY